MQKKKVEKLKQKRIKSEDEYDIGRFIKVLLIVLFFVALIYLFTRLVIKKDLLKDKGSTETTEVVEINTDKLIVGNMLNSKSYSNYYVFLYSGSDSKAILYSSYIDLYSKKDAALKCYWVDLDNSLNSKYLAKKESTNPKATKIEELKLGNYTLIKIKDSKIVKYLEDIKSIKTELGI